MRENKIKGEYKQAMFGMDGYGVSWKVSLVRYGC